MIERREAVLLYDSARADSYIGARASPEVERSVVFFRDGLTVDLLLHEFGSHMRYVHGQVIEESGSPVAGAVTRMEGGSDAVTTDALGQFALSGPFARGDEVVTIDIGPAQLVCTIPRERAAAGWSM